MKYTAQEIENAKNILIESGYMVESLWSLPDILENYETQEGNEVDDDTAYDILQKAVTNPYIIEEIWTSIDMEATEYNLRIKED